MSFPTVFISICMLSSMTASFAKTSTPFPSRHTEVCQDLPICADVNHTVQVSIDITDCCKPCSCLHDCGMDSTCCFSEVTELELTQCQTPVFKDFYHSSVIHFIMTNTCPIATDQENYLCAQTTTTHLGTKLPVYSPSEDKTYFNSYCAICNNVTDGIPWQAMVVCEKPYDARSLSMEVEHAIRENGDALGSCELRFYPPDILTNKAETCANAIVQRCHQLSHVRTFPKNESNQWMCPEKFTARFRPLTDRYLYPAKTRCTFCDKTTGSLDSNRISCKFTPKGNFAATIEPFLYKTGTYQSLKKKTGDQVCISEEINKKRVIICRPVLCPEPKYFYKMECRLIYTTIISASVRLVLKLTPTNPKQLISLHDMNKLKRNPRRLQMNGLNTWNFLHMYFHLSSEAILIDYLIFDLLFVISSLNASQSLSTIETALQSSWSVEGEEELMQFKAEFNQVLSYRRESEPHTITNYGRVNVFKPVRGSVKADISTRLSDEKIYRDINYFEISFDKPPLFITELYFCNQLEFSSDGYQEYGSVVFIKASGQYLDEGQYLKVKKTGQKKSVRVCVKTLKNVDIKNISNLYKTSDACSCGNFWKNLATLTLAVWIKL